jgi:hypothetical protein
MRRSITPNLLPRLVEFVFFLAAAVALAAGTLAVR